MISVILTIHNQEDIINNVLSNLFINSSRLVNNVFILFDGCTDNSELITKLYIENNVVLPNIHFYNLDNVFETKANNFALKLIKTRYAIIVQDDCVITENRWDMRLLEPIKIFKDVFAVSGRASHNIKILDNGLVDYFDIADKEHGADKDIFYIRQVVNRGPLLLDMDVVRKLNYLDEEFYPQNQDDHDLCLRAYLEGWKCGSYWIDYISNPSWGGTRKGNGEWIRSAIEKNMHIINTRYRALLSSTWNEERDLWINKD